MNLITQSGAVRPTIEMFVTALQAGVNAWEAAGKILVSLRHEDEQVFQRIQKEHPFITPDMLEVFWNFGMRTMYPMVSLLPNGVRKHVQAMRYDAQVKICSEPVQVVTRLVGDKPVVVRKPVSRLTELEARRALGPKGNVSVERQVRELTAPPPDPVTMMPKTVVTERRPKEVARFAVSRGVAGTWRFEPTMANPFTTQRVRLELGQCVIVIEEYQQDQE